MKKPMGNLPLTLSNVSAGDKKSVSRLAENTLRKVEKLDPCKILSFEKFAIVAPGISM